MRTNNSIIIPVIISDKRELLETERIQKKNSIFYFITGDRRWRVGMYYDWLLLQWPSDMLQLFRDGGNGDETEETNYNDNDSTRTK